MSYSTAPGAAKPRHRRKASRGQRRSGRALALLLLSALVLAACGTDDGAGSDTAAADQGDPATGTDNSATDDAATGIEGADLHFVTFGMQYEFIVGLVSTTESELEAAGANVTVVDGRSDPNLQTTQIQDALAQQPDALIVDPVDPDLMLSGIQSAGEQGVPVFVAESLPEGVEYTAFVGYDNVAAGALGAETLADLIGGEGTVLQLKGSDGSKQARERKQGFDEAMANYPDITVRDLNTEWTAENANSMVLDAFTTNPDIAGVWSHNDEMIRGAAQALEQLGRLTPSGEEGHVSIVGHDGTPLALQRIREGTQDASVVYDAIEMGRITASNIVAHLNGEAFDQDTIIEPFMVDSSNVDEPTMWGNLEGLE